MESNWNQKVPLSISLSHDTSKKSFKLSVTPHTYLHLLLPKLVSFFSNELQNVPLNQLWFQCGDQTLSWDLPVDVLMSICRINPGDEFNVIINTKSQYPSSILPIPTNSRISIDRTNLQTTDSFDSECLRFLEKNWLNKLKESCYIINGNANLIMKMSTNDTKSWFNDGVKLSNNAIFDKFFNRIVRSNIKNLPIYIHTNKDEVPLIRVTLPQSFTNFSIKDLLQLYDINASTITVNQIIIPLNAPILDIYKIFKSIDLTIHFFVLD